MNRTAEVSRTTGETEIKLSLRLDGTGRGARSTGVGFFDHMLDAVARHGRLDLDAGLTEEFLRAVANQAKLTLHVTVEAGGNDHHVVEAAFKAFARALRAAVALDSTITDVPSTKGLL